MKQYTPDRPKTFVGIPKLADQLIDEGVISFLDTFCRIGWGGSLMPGRSLFARLKTGAQHFAHKLDGLALITRNRALHYEGWSIFHPDPR